jgi:hypothetical protein
MLNIAQPRPATAIVDRKFPKSHPRPGHGEIRPNCTQAGRGLYMWVNDFDHTKMRHTHYAEADYFRNWHICDQMAVVAERCLCFKSRPYSRMNRAAIPEFPRSIVADSSRRAAAKAAWRFTSIGNPCLAKPGPDVLLDFLLPDRVVGVS